jgi:aspartate dehydrogenase
MFTGYSITKVGIAGIGALGSAVAKALINGIDGFDLVAISDPNPIIECNIPNLPFEELVKKSDLVIECLPPSQIPPLLNLVLKHEKDMIMISACALLINPEFEAQIRSSKSRVIVPSGALAGIDGVSSLKQMGITNASIASTKKPLAYDGAPYITQNNIDLTAIKEKTRLFSGNAIEAAKGFPANLNVAATLSFAGIGAEKTKVEIWADPQINGNQHEITIEGEFSTINCRIKNTPDPQNPKSSMLAAQSIIATLRNMKEQLVIV